MNRACDSVAICPLIPHYHQFATGGCKQAKPHIETITILPTTVPVASLFVLLSVLTAGSVCVFCLLFYHIPACGTPFKGGLPSVFDYTLLLVLLLAGSIPPLKGARGMSSTYYLILPLLGTSGGGPKHWTYYTRMTVFLSFILL